MESVIDILLRIKRDSNDVLGQVASDLKEVSQAASTIGPSEGVDELSRGLSASTPEAKLLTQVFAQLNGSLAQTTPELYRVVDGADRTSSKMGELSGASTSASKEIDVVSASIRRLTGIMLGFLAVGSLKKFADDAAQVQVAATVLNVVALNAGITSASVQGVNKEIQALGITARDSSKSLTTFIQAGLAGVSNESIGKAKELAIAARDLAVVSGQNTSDTYSRLITNIQQMDTMGLRFMGITVERADAEERYAAAVGKSAAALTPVEQRQAFMNEVLKESTKLAGAYESAMGDVGKQITSLARLEEELSVSIGTNLLPAYSALVSEFSTFLKQAKLVSDVEGQSSTAARDLGEAVRSGASALRESTVWIIEHGSAVKTLFELWLGYKAITIATPVIVAVVSAFVRASGAVTLFYRSVQAGFPTMVAAEAGLGAMGGSVGALSTRITGLKSLASAGSIGGLLSAAFTGFEIGDVLNKFAVVRNTAAASISGTASLYNLLFGSKAEYERSKQIFQEDMSNLMNGVDTEANTKSLDAFREKTAEIIALTAQRADLERQLVDAQKGIGGKTSQEVQAEIDKTKAKEKQVQAEVDALKASGQVVSVNAERIAQEERLRAEANLTKREIDSQLESIKQAQERLGYRSKEGVVTAQVTADIAAMETLYQNAFSRIYKGSSGVGKSLSEAIAEGGQDASAALVELNFEFDALLSRAKTPLELAAAFNAVGNYAQILGVRVKAAKETLNFQLEKAELERLNSALAGFNARLTSVREVMETVAFITEETRNSQQQWATTIAGLGGSFDSTGALVSKGGASVKVFAENVRQLSSLSVNGIIAGLDQAMVKYQQEETAIRASYDRRKALAVEFSATGQLSAAQGTAIDRDALNTRIANATQYYNSLKQLRDESLGLYKSYADKVRELDQKLFDTREAKERDLREIRRKGMTESEANADRMVEYQEALAKAQEAMQAKAYDKAAEYASRAKELAKGMGLSADAEAKAVEKAWDALIKSQEAQRDEQRKSAAEQLDAYNKVSSALTELTTKLGSMASEQFTKLMVSVDMESLDQAVKQVQSAFSGINIKVSTSTAQDQTISGFAAGGLVRGPGTTTSDSILAALSHTEFVTRAKAVMGYGDDVFHALNNMAIPRHIVRAAVLGEGLLPRFNTGVMVGGVTAQLPSSGNTEARDSVNLNLSFNSKPAGRVTGSRQSVQALVSALKEASRGV